jgi:hypothetical protein
MKKKVLMGLVLLIVIGTSAVFAQSQEKYYLEIYNISQATFSPLGTSRRQNDPNHLAMEDDYFFVRTASGTTLRYRAKDLTFEQVRQNLLSIAPQLTAYVNFVNNEVLPYAQKYWLQNFWYSNARNPEFRIYVWCRRTE